MQKYNSEIRRIIIAVVIIAVIIASAILITAYLSQPSNQNDLNSDSEPEHTLLLPTAPLTVIVDSGSQGTEITGILEFGFLEHSTGYSIGVILDYLQIHNGYNLIDAIGLGYAAVRSYSFAYLGENILFDSWDSKTPDSVYYSSSVAWSPNEKSTMHVGDIPLGEIDEVTQAGYIVEYEDLRIYFEDGSSFLCGPANLTLGVNFTRIDGEWNIEYILDATPTDQTNIGFDAVEIQLTEEIRAQATETIVTDSMPAPAADYAFGGSPLLSFISIPAIIGLIVIGVVLLGSKKKSNV